MCGIAGFTHSKGSPGPERIRRAVASLIHRGPDQQGVFESDSVSLGVARLKIICLSTGDQPISSANGDAVIAFNGEIYNHREIRQELARRGRRFRTESDTETVLEAFLEWDTECFSRLRGMFGVALWVESSQRLVLARDRIGIKPLYIARRGDDLYFGSELKAIFVHPEIDRRLSPAGLDCYLSLNYTPCPWTLVDGIEKLRPGHWLEWRGGKLRSESYWSAPPAQLPWKLDDAKQKLDSLLTESVREHLVSEVPVGVWLSGGIDSSTLVHYASNASSSRLKTFSVSFHGRSFDETSYIRQIAAQYDTDHEELDLNPGSGLEDAIEAFADYSDDPNGDAGALPVWFLSKLTKKTVTVALSGEGADELFGGYLTHRASLLARSVRKLPGLGLMLGGLRHWPVSDEKISLEYKLKRFLEGCRMAPERAHIYWNGTFSDREKLALLRAESPGTLDRILGELRDRGDALSAYLWFDQKYYLPDDVLAKADRMSMAHAVEVRPPFLDHRIVEFAASLPPHLLIEGSKQKVILRELMQGKLPASILRRKKIGFDIPAHDWLRGPLRPLLVDTLEAGAAEHAELFDRAAIQSCLRAHLERRANLGYHLWGLMILFLWMKKWGIQSAPVAEAHRQSNESALALT